MIRIKLEKLFYKIKSIFKKKQYPHLDNCSYDPLKEYPSCTMTTDENGILKYVKYKFK